MVLSFRSSFILHLSPPSSIGDNVLFDVETDFRFWRSGRRFQQRPKFLEDVAQSRVVDEQGFFNLGQAFENGGVGGEVCAHLHEGADDIEAHRIGAGAVEDVGNHEGAVLSKGTRKVFPTGSSA